MSESRARPTVGSVFLFTHEVRLALAAGGVELVVKILLFYVHERARNSVPRGKATQPCAGSSPVPRP